jgi:broad specificity phosphatase PhoE
MILTFMRHPAIDLESGRCIGQTDVDLSSAGRSSLQLQKRVSAGISKLDPNSAYLLIVTHAGMIRAAQAAFSGLPLCRAMEYHIPYGGMYLGIWGGRASLRASRISASVAPMWDSIGTAAQQELRPTAQTPRHPETPKRPNS